MAYPAEPQYNAGDASGTSLRGAMEESKQPHWAWPHVVGVFLAIAAYFVVYRYTGDSDLFPALVAALAVGAGGIAATWAYIRYILAPRSNRPQGPPAA
jgi:uncharacterized membrane protein HdeD (DUF308 family)